VWHAARSIRTDEAPALPHIIIFIIMHRFIPFIPFIPSQAIFGARVGAFLGMLVGNFVGAFVGGFVGASVEDVIDSSRSQNRESWWPMSSASTAEYWRRVTFRGIRRSLFSLRREADPAAAACPGAASPNRRASCTLEPMSPDSPPFASPTRTSPDDTAFSSYERTKHSSTSREG
jgi:hypothetical protein